MFEALKRLFGFKEPDYDTQVANYYAQLIINELTRMNKSYVKKTKDGVYLTKVRFKPPIKVTPTTIELEVDSQHLPYGISIVELKDSKLVEGLETVCKKPITVKHERGSGFWYIVRRHNTGKHNFEFADLRAGASYDPTKTPLYIPIGRDDHGEQIWRDLERIYHLLIAGATGKGKTRTIHSIITWLITHTQPGHVRLILVDLKEGLDLSRYNGVPHLQFPVAIEPLAAYEALKWVNDEISRRGELFRAVNAENIHTYRQRTGKFLNNIVFVFDEITNIQKLKLIGHKDKVVEAEFYLRDGAQRARALGVHFIISTQRPSVEVIDGDIKMNFTARIGFGTATDTDSRVILDNNMATGLEVGDLIYQDSGNRGVLLRGPYIATDHVDRLVAAVIERADEFRKIEILEESLTAISRDRIKKAMLNYARHHLEGKFVLEKLYPAFSQDVTYDELKTIAKELEDEKKLTPSAGRRPRQVLLPGVRNDTGDSNDQPLSFVGCQMSDTDKTENAPLLAENGKYLPLDGDNNYRHDDNGDTGDNNNDSRDNDIDAEFNDNFNDNNERDDQ